MKKVLIVCGCVWAVIIVFVLIGRLFNATGLLIVILSLLIMALLITIYDLTLSFLISSYLKKASLNGQFKFYLDKGQKLNKFPLSTNEFYYLEMLEIMCLINLGQFNKATELLDSTSYQSIKKANIARGFYQLKVDLAFGVGNKDDYLAAQEEMKVKFNLEKDPSYRIDLLSGQFYFMLKEGFLDRDKEKEAIEYYQMWEDSSYMDKLLGLYINAMISSVTNQSINSKEELLKLAEGTYLEKEVNSLLNK